jgi:hypothetical protein
MKSNRRFFLLLITSGSIQLLLPKTISFALQRVNKVVNVRKYGAVGDGRQDDTSAIQSAINSGKIIYFPTGIYKVNGLKLRSDSTYYGDGDRSIIKLFQNQYSPTEVANYASNSAFNLVNVNNTVVRNLKFICPSSNTKASPLTEYANIAIDIQSSTDCRISSIAIEQFSGIGVLCAGTSDRNRCERITIDRVKIKNWYPTYDGSFPQIWFFKYVHNSIVKNSELAGGTFGIGFYDAYNGTKISNSGQDIPGAGVYKCQAINNKIENQSRYGILLYCTRSVAFAHESVKHVIKGNKINNIRGSSATTERSFGAGIYAVGVKDLVISQNTVSNCNQITNNAALAPGCIGVISCSGDILIDRNICSKGQWSNLYINNINFDRSGQLIVKHNTLRNSVKENLFCSNCHNAIFYGNKILSDKTAQLTPVSFRSVKNVTFEKNNILFDSNVNHDTLFVFQSKKIKILNNKIVSLNPLSISRFQEVADSIISGNVYESANRSSHEVVQFRKGKNNKFINNMINKRFGGSKIKSY